LNQISGLLIAVSEKLVIEPPTWTLIIVSSCALLAPVALIGMTFAAGRMLRLAGKVMPAPFGVASIVACTVVPSLVQAQWHREGAPVVWRYQKTTASTVAIDANDYRHGPPPLNEATNINPLHTRCQAPKISARL
jgi:hypothetical protein